MKKLWLAGTLAVGMIAAVALPAWSMPAGEAAVHVGETVTVDANVSQIAHPGRLTLVDLDAPYPDMPLTLVIYPQDAGTFTGVDGWQGHAITVTGPVTLYKGRPEIVLRRADQVKLH